MGWLLANELLSRHEILAKHLITFDLAMYLTKHTTWTVITTNCLLFDRKHPTSNAVLFFSQFNCIWISPFNETIQCWFCCIVLTASFLLKTYHGGHIVIRLAMAGHKQSNRPFYRIVAAYNKRARDSKYIEQLGSYDPLPNIYNEKLVSINSDRIKYWMGCGAHPTKPVAKLLGVFPLPSPWQHTLYRFIEMASVRPTSWKRH